MSLDSFLNMFETEVSRVARVQPCNGVGFGCNPSEKPRVSGVALDTPDTSRNPERYQHKPLQGKGCTLDTPDTPDTLKKSKPKHEAALQEEFHCHLAWVAKYLDADLNDLLDWYKKDIEDVCRMDGKDLLSIVREYLTRRDYYRGS